MLFKDISLVDENMSVQKHRYLGTIGDRISYLGTAMPENPEQFGPVYSCSKGRLLVPGFVNAHTHLPMYLLRGYAENMTLMDWLKQRIFPFEAQLNGDDVYAATMLSCAEMLRFGTVSCSDMYYFGESLGRAFAESGVKANFSLGTLCSDDRSYEQLPIWAETMQTKRDFHGYDNGRLKVDFSLHAEYTNTEKVIRGLAEKAAEEKLRLQVHLSETASEVGACRSRHNNRTPVRFLADCRLFDVPVTAAHCVHVDDDDIAILVEKGVTAVNCPTSNLKLASGICPGAKFLRAGVNLALGTDSVASNNNLDMNAEMKLFSIVHKGISGDPTIVTPAQALYAATRAGALSQGRNDCGLLKEGFKADIAVFNTDQIYMRPCHSLLNNLIYAASGTDVCLTMVDGRVLYEDGIFPTIDVEKFTALAERSIARITTVLAGKK